MTEFTNTKGAFWLFEARERQLNSNWVVIPAQQKSPIGFYGWYAGGYAPGLGSVSTVDRLAISTRTISSSGGAAILNRRGQSETAANATAAYFGGGTAGAVGFEFPATSNINKLTFKTEGWSTIGPKLPIAMLYNSHVTDSLTYGWALSGQFTNTPSSTRAYSSATRIEYSNDNVSTIPSALTHYASSAASTPAGYGWTFGGSAYEFSTGTIARSTTTWFAFSNGAVGIQNYDPIGATFASTALNNKNKAEMYVIGGSGISSSIRKFSWTAGTFYSVSTNYTSSLSRMNSKSISTEGFYSGGVISNAVSNITNYKFATDAISNITPKLSVARGDHYAV